LIPDISLPFLSVLEARKNVKTKDEQSHQVSHQVRLLRTQSSLISTNQSFHLLVMLVLVQQPIGLCGPRVHDYIGRQKIGPFCMTQDPNLSAINSAI